MSNELIGNVRERWAELGNDDPDRVAERYRGDPWRLFYNGWIEGRSELISARAKDAEVIAALTDRLDNTEKALRVAELGIEQRSELIQRLVDVIKDAETTAIACREILPYAKDDEPEERWNKSVDKIIDLNFGNIEQIEEALNAAAAAGFKPSEQ